MDNIVSKYVVILIFLLGASILSGCEDEIKEGNGRLEGIISIGPICPVETDPPEPACLPTAETYNAYPVYVWTANKSRKVAKIEPELDGSFFLELAAGDYIVDLDKEQIALGGSNLPMGISIEPLATASLSIEIDTGIR